MTHSFALNTGYAYLNWELLFADFLGPPRPIQSISAIFQDGLRKPEVIFFRRRLFSVNLEPVVTYATNICREYG